MNTETLSNFFNQLSNDVLDNNLSIEQINRLEKFYSEYTFIEQCDVDSSDEIDDSVDSIMKFYTMGWYVYSCINENKKLK